MNIDGAPAAHPVQPQFVAPGRAQWLADLRWLLQSPPLLSPGSFPGMIHRFTAREAQAVEAWLRQLEAQSAQPEVGAWGLDRPLRLGRYAEKLLRFFLGSVRSSPDQAHDRDHGFELLAHSLARRGASGEASTLGEIDFLLQTPDGLSWHWELAVKVYLCEERAMRGDPAIALPRHLHGPNRAETFEIKLEKLFTKQMCQPIPTLPVDASQGDSFARQWQRAAFAKGRIFYRRGESPPLVVTDRHLPLLDARHLRGFWCPATELADLLDEHPGSWAYPLKRLEWMSTKNSDTLDASRPAMSVESAGALSSPVMIALMRDNEEITRGFLLPPKPPAAAPTP